MHHARRMAAVAVSCQVALLGAVPPAVAVEAGVLVVTPADDGSGRSVATTLEPALAPGGRALLRVEVRNTAGIEVTVLAYGADVEGDEVGDGIDETGVGSWIATRDARTKLRPGALGVVEFEITRPEEDTGGGVGALVLQLADDSREELGLPTTTRAAIEVVVAADGAGEGLQVRTLELDVETGPTLGGVVASVELHNPGSQPVEVAGEVVLGAGEAERVRLPSRSVGPGGTASLEVPIDDLPLVAGTLRARVELDGTAVVPVSAPAARFLMQPWAAAITVLLTLLATVRVGRVVRDARRRSGPSSQDDDPDGSGRAPDDAGSADEEPPTIDVPVVAVEELELDHEEPDLLGGDDDASEDDQA